MIRVLLADDEELVREGFRMILEAQDDFEVVGEASDAKGAVELTLRERPDLCLLDVCMPGNGIRAAADILASVPETRVVLMTIAASDEDMLAALAAGAAGLQPPVDPGHRDLPQQCEDNDRRCGEGDDHARLRPRRPPREGRR